MSNERLKWLVKTTFFIIRFVLQVFKGFRSIKFRTVLIYCTKWPPYYVTINKFDSLLLRGESVFLFFYNETIEIVVEKLDRFPRTIEYIRRNYANRIISFFRKTRLTIPIFLPKDTWRGGSNYICRGALRIVFIFRKPSNSTQTKKENEALFEPKKKRETSLPRTEIYPRRTCLIQLGTENTHTRGSVFAV